MVAIIQRVSNSCVKVDNKEIAKISKGFNILLGVLKGDTKEDISKLIKKIVNLRVFANECGKMDLSIAEVGGEALVVSQFTLAANVKKGKRPSFDRAMPPKEAKELYEEFCSELEKFIPTKRGVFGAMMEVEIINDGPVTFILDSRKL